MVDPELIEKTKQQIRQLVTEIARLAQQNVSAAEFYRGFLDRVVSCLAASGGAVWTVNDASDLKLACQINLPETLRTEKHGGFLRRVRGVLLAASRRESLQKVERHAALLRKTLYDGRGAVIPPHSGEGGSNPPNNPINSMLVLGVLKVDREPKGVVEIFQRVGAPDITQRGYLKFVCQMCDLANGYLQNHR